MTARNSALAAQLIEAGLSPIDRKDDRGPLRAMCKAECYVMVRRPGCMPFVMREADWLSLPATERAA